MCIRDRQEAHDPPAGYRVHWALSAPCSAPGFKRIRHYGLLSPARKKRGLAAARAALDVPPPQPKVIESVAEFLRRVARIEHEHCLHCGIGQFRVSGVILPEHRLHTPRGPP